MPVWCHNNLQCTLTSTPLLFAIIRLDSSLITSRVSIRNARSHGHEPSHGHGPDFPHDMMLGVGRNARAWGLGVVGDRLPR